MRLASSAARKFPRGPIAPLLALLLPTAALAADVAPPPAAGAELPSIAFSQYVTPNGLHVILSEDHTVPIVTTYVTYLVGSKDEKPGRTGFAHLFEHVMFQGSKHVGDDQHFKLLESVGGRVNGNTTQDRTVYFETVPSQYLERALWLESDRMGYLLDTLDQGKLDQQRDVVKNERRQSYENRPYGLAYEKVLDALYPAGHPYHWPTIGSMQDLTAATLDDVKDFFRQYYVPKNAALVIVGDFDPEQAKALVARYFDPLPGGAVPQHAAPAELKPLEQDVALSYEDEVQVPRTYVVWRSPALYQPGDAALDVTAHVLAGGRSSRLYKRLVFGQLATDVTASQNSQQLTSSFWIVATARPGKKLEDLEKIIDEEVKKLAAEPPTAEEVLAAQTELESNTTFSLEAGLSRASRMADDFRVAGDPGYISKDIATHRGVTPAHVTEATRTYLGQKRVVLHVLPRAAPAKGSEKKPADQKPAAKKK